VKFLKILVLLVGVLFMGANCNLFKTSTSNNASPSTDLTGQDNKTTQNKTLTNLAKAKAASLAWQNDAVFVAYNFKVPPDFDPKSLVETFVFGSSKEPDYWWTYSLASDQSKPVRAMVNKDDYLGRDLSPIQEQYWKVSYADAIKTAEENSGLTFRAENPETEITVTLSQSQPKNWLWYVVEYRGATKSQKIRINANDGKVYNDQGILQTSPPNTNSSSNK